MFQQQGLKFCNNKWKKVILKYTILGKFKVSHKVDESSVHISGSEYYGMYMHVHALNTFASWSSWNWKFLQPKTMVTADVAIVHLENCTYLDNIGLIIEKNIRSVEEMFAGKQHFIIQRLQSSTISAFYFAISECLYSRHCWDRSGKWDSSNESVFESEKVRTL